MTKKNYAKPSLIIVDLKANEKFAVDVISSDVGYSTELEFGGLWE